MNRPPNDHRARYRLDDLLARLPPMGGEATDAAWQSKLERTLQRVRSLSPSTSDGAEGATTENQVTDEQLLRTPLPVEAGEPESSDPSRFVADPSAAYDELRAPLQSGEHVPVRFAPPVDDRHIIPSEIGSEGGPTRAPGRIYWIAGGLGTLAAAAAIAIFIGRRAPAEFTRPAADHYAERLEQNHASAATESATRGENPIVTALPGSRVGSLAVEAQSGPPAAEGAPARIATNRERPKAANARTEVGAVASSNEPVLVPAAGPANLIDHPSTGAVSAALSRRLQAAQRCLSPRLPTTGVRVTFRSGGTVQNVEILDSGADTVTRACVQEALQGAKVEPFARAQYDVTTTISLPAPAVIPSGK
jgi:hypothetical protein